MAKFRFQDLDIWKVSIEIADELFVIANDLEKRKLYRFAEQLRGATMSMSNNIAEGSGSSSTKEFQHFLNYTRRSIFENANITILLQRQDIITQAKKEQILDSLDILSRKVYRFRQSLDR